MKDFKTRILDSGWTIIFGVALFGPLALPLLWRNPKFGRAAKVLWTIVTVLLTIFCIWALKYSALMISNSMATEPCRIERYRPAYPPGERAVKVFVGSDSKKPVEKFAKSKELFEYLKQANGKICDVNWKEAKDTIENWINTWQSAEDSVGPEINALIAQQAALEAQKGQPPTDAQPTAQNPKTCESKLLQIRDRLSALKSKAYDSQKVRAAEIESILRSLEPGPLL